MKLIHRSVFGLLICKVLNAVFYLLCIVHIVIKNLIYAVLSLVAFSEFICLVDWIFFHLHVLLLLLLLLLVLLGSLPGNADDHCDEHNDEENPDRQENSSQEGYCKIILFPAIPGRSTLLVCTIYLSYRWCQWYQERSLLCLMEEWWGLRIFHSDYSEHIFSL